MSDINVVALSGNLGSEPEIKYFESGKIKTTFSIAQNEYKGKDKKPQVNWFKCVAWGKLAEMISDFATKGTRVFVSGQLSTSEFSNENNIKIKQTFLKVENITINSTKNKE